MAGSKNSCEGLKPGLALVNTFGRNIDQFCRNNTQVLTMYNVDKTKTELKKEENLY